MPLYQYKCPSCSHDFESFKPVAERATDECPVCKAEAVLQVSKCGFVIYGYCYENEYAGDKEKKGPR